MVERLLIRRGAVVSGVGFETSQTRRQRQRESVIPDRARPPCWGSGRSGDG